MIKPDYQKIKLGDPGGELIEAFNIMKAEVVETRPVVMLSYIEISKVDFNISAELEASVIANMPDWVHRALSNGGIDVNDPQTPALLDMLVSPESKQILLDMGIVEKLKYPNLKLGHLETARAL